MPEATKEGEVNFISDLHNGAIVGITGGTLIQIHTPGIKEGISLNKQLCRVHIDEDQIAYIIDLPSVDRSQGTYRCIVKTDGVYIPGEDLQLEGVLDAREVIKLRERNIDAVLRAHKRILRVLDPYVRDLRIDYFSVIGAYMIIVTTLEDITSTCISHLNSWQDFSLMDNHRHRKFNDLLVRYWNCYYALDQKNLLTMSLLEIKMYVR
jgi:hypothetical protein